MSCGYPSLSLSIASASDADTAPQSRLFLSIPCMVAGFLSPSIPPAFYADIGSPEPPILGSYPA